MNLLTLPKSIWSNNPIPNGCVLYAPLWNPGLSGPVFNTIDSYGYPLTVTGAVYGSQGRTYDTVPDDYIDCGNPANLGFTTQNFTMWAWLKTSSAAEQGMIAKWDAGTVKGYYLFLTGGKIGAYACAGANFIALTGGTATYNDGAFHLFVITVNIAGKTITNYADGVPSDRTTAETGTFTVIQDTGRNLLLGARHDGASITGNINGGTLGEAGINLGIMSAGEVAYLYSNSYMRRFA